MVAMLTLDMDDLSWDWELPYPSRRQPVLADNVVATSQPLAAQAGLSMLARGGNAVDAAVATAVTLTVVEPTGNGLGSDAFAIVWDGERLHGLNASGRSPQALDPTRYAGRGAMPLRGWDSVTVPGAVSAWAMLSKRFGALDFAELCAPAAAYARRGFAVSPVTAALWARAPATFAGFADFAEMFLPGGRAPLPGERFASPHQAASIEAIANTGGEAFYRGRLAEQIAACARAAGAPLAEEDLATHRADWVDPLAVSYGGLTVHELPPNSQGLAALLALGILDHGPGTDGPPDDADTLHTQIEAMKLAFADVHAHVADPGAMAIAPGDLLAPDRLEAHARRIDPHRAADPGHGRWSPGGTVYVATADERGTMVSFIQSNYFGFGSGVVVPETGISLQNRGAAFVTDPDHPNAVAPGKRPYHTIMPGFVSRNGRPLGVFGVMGGPMQPQGHVQLVSRLACGQSPQAVVDAPRWRVEAGLEIVVEDGVTPRVRESLAARGHRLAPAPGMGAFGGAQLALQLPGGHAAASDPRKDGQAVGF